MNKFVTQLLISARRKATLGAVVFSALLVLLLGLMISGVILFQTFNAELLGSLEFCLTSQCVDFWLKKNESVILVLSVTGSAIIGLVTIGGIIVALLSYKNAVSYATVSNHLSHLNIFMAYVLSETARRSLLCRSDVESLKWYNFIYSESATGRFNISPQYCDFICRLNRQISDSNSKYISASKIQGDNYRYKDHQKQMILILKEVGVYLEGLPRMDFNEVEAQVLDLIDTVNKSFCRDESIPEIGSRAYH